ncbi:MAG: pseudaminic acid cytidylyltransferase [Flavobacteriaceae bacterium]|tara:strand:- start:1648 stop:2340 length:693 start_codon:yes stop_codon:yes gene_type:complete
MRKIAIIPARGGSKRIPRKNIKEFFGKPVIAYAIELALNSNFFEKIIVSTDDNEIMDIAKLYGAQVPFLRSKETSTDNSTTFDVIKEVLDWYNLKGEFFEVGCCIYPVTPLLTFQTLEKGLKELIKKSCDSVVPLTPFTHPIQRAIIINKKGFIEKQNKFLFKKNTQDLPMFYHDTGQFYWFFTNRCLDFGEIITNNSSSFFLNFEEYQDVDNLYDWRLLELKYKLKQEK